MIGINICWWYSRASKHVFGEHSVWLWLILLDTMQAYAELLEEEGITVPAWFSFNSKDGINVVSGDSILECASIADSCEQVVAVGINCTAPRFIHGLILSVRKV